MKELIATFKLAAALLALPLAATAAAAGYQAMDQDWSEVSLPTAANPAAVSAATFSSLRQHAIGLDAEGMLNGRIVSLAGQDGSASGIGQLEIVFGRDGLVVARTTTNSDGSFQASGLTPGVYSFVAQSDQGLAAFGINVLPYDEQAPLLTLEAAAVTLRPQSVLESMESEVIAYQGRPNNELMLVGGNRVMLDGDVLRGSIMSIYLDGPVEGTIVKVVSQNGVAASARVAADGSYEIPGLSSGVYEFTASGPHGYAALAFEAISTEALTRVVRGTRDDVSVSTAGGSAPAQEAGPTDSLDVTLVPEQLVRTAPAPQSDVTFFDDTIGVGGACGSCGGGCDGGYVTGGGGGGFGGFGGGRLLPLAALGIGIAALATDGNGNGGGPGPGSPVQP